MTVFRILAYLAPLAIGLAVPAALALTRGKPAGRRVIWSVSVFGAILILLATVALFAGAFGAWLELAVLLTAFGLLIAGLCLFVESIGLPGEAGQIVAALLTVALITTVFWFAPMLNRQIEKGASASTIHDRISFALAASPLMTTGYSILEEDLLVSRSFYPLHFRDYQFTPPRWGMTSFGYGLVGLAFGGLAWGIFALRRHRQGSPA